MKRRLTNAELALLGIVRRWEKFEHDTSAMMASSHRLGHRQRKQLGHFWYESAHVPGVAFEKQWMAVKAARKAIGLEAT